MARIFLLFWEMVPGTTNTRTSPATLLQTTALQDSNVSSMGQVGRVRPNSKPGIRYEGSYNPKAHLRVTRKRLCATPGRSRGAPEPRIARREPLAPSAPSIFISRPTHPLHPITNPKTTRSGRVRPTGGSGEYSLGCTPNDGLLCPVPPANPPHPLYYKQDRTRKDALSSRTAVSRL